jgi:hypothetical protein
MADDATPAFRLPDGATVSFAELCAKVRVAEARAIVGEAEGNDFSRRPIVHLILDDPLVSADFERRADGIHFRAFDSSIDTLVDSVEVYLIFKGTNAQIPEFRRKITAAAAAIIAFRAHGVDTDRHRWVRMVYQRMLSLSTKHGANAYFGISKPFVDFISSCSIELDRVMKQRLHDIMQRIRSDMASLVDHVDEEEICMMWREAVAARVHDS